MPASKTLHSDAYTLPDEPYSVICVVVYTDDELREIDAYAAEYGIELMSCIQTPGHYTNLVKHSVYRDIIDCGDILLIDEENLEKNFRHLAEVFTSRHQHRHGRSRFRRARALP